MVGLAGLAFEPFARTVLLGWGPCSSAGSTSCCLHSSLLIVYDLWHELAVRHTSFHRVRNKRVCLPATERAGIRPFEYADRFAAVA